ncbi:hypothetical protein [Sporocytophaga myxococcoides]|uniref:hypothetical protein n=1 Tax=Sporocytophaga myxococcoides TaxID=153721 RepID=UPI0004205E56|nr:hypothetical protein [Sporocytophaga myxococcoides]
MTSKILFFNKTKTKVILPFLLTLSLSAHPAFCNIQIDTAYIDNKGIFQAKINSITDSIAIERLLNRTWIIDTVINNREFTYKPKYTSGINKFRLRGLNTNYIYKDTLTFRNESYKPWGPKRCVDTIKLPDKYEYKLMDSAGRIIKTGMSDTIDLRGIRAGVYYLEYDNTTEKFLKKDK